MRSKISFGRSVAGMALAALVALAALLAPASQALAFAGPDKIAFVRGGDIWAIDPDRTHEQQLTSGTAFTSPTWSPNRDAIAFVSTQVNRQNLYVLHVQYNATTGKLDLLDPTPVPLTSGPSGLMFGPEWGPATAQYPNGAIVFSSGRDGDPDLYVLDPSSPGGWMNNQLTGISDSANDVWPSWSPDGKWIVFSSNRSGSGALYVMPATGDPLGAQSVQITATGGLDSEWSPFLDANHTQSRVAFMRGGDVWVVDITHNADGSIASVSSPRQVTTNGGTFPSWAPPTSFAPSGAPRIAFQSSRSGPARIYTLDDVGNNGSEAGENIAAITTGPGKKADERPAWNK